MTTAQPTYYEPSGAVGPLGVIACLAVGPPIAWVLGLIYAYLIFYIPFVYLNFLITVGLGFAMGLVAIGCIRTGHVRSPFAGFGMGLFLGGLALWFQWSRWMAIFTEHTIDTYSPLLLGASMAVTASEGAWSILSVTPTGLVLWVIWLVEAGIILGIPAVVALGATSDPYCERCKVWLKTSSTIGPFVPLRDPEAFVERLLRRVPHTTDELQMSTLGAARYSELGLLNCPECRRFHVMTITTVTITHDENNKEKRDEDVEVDNLVLPAAVYGELWNHARGRLRGGVHVPGT